MLRTTADAAKQATSVTDEAPVDTICEIICLNDTIILANKMLNITQCHLS